MFKNPLEELVQVDCQLSQQMRRKELVKKVKECPEASLDLEMSCLKQYPKFDNHFNEILSVKPAAIQRLSLIFNCLDLEKQQFSAISKCLSQMKQIQYLSIEISNSGVMDSDFKYLLYEISDMSQLQQLSLNVSSNDKISFESAQELGVCLGQLISLKKLELNLSECINIDDKFIERVCSLIKRMISLSALSLHLQNSNVKSFEFIQCLSEIALLNKFQLSYALLPEQNKYFSSALQLLSSKIRSFSLNLQGSQFTQDDQLKRTPVSILGNVLVSFSQLQKLYMNLENSKINVQDVFLFLQNLANLLQILQFKLYFNVSEIHIFKCALNEQLKLQAETLSCIALRKYLSFTQFQKISSFSE